MKLSNISNEILLARRKEIGEKLKEIRLSKNLTMEQLGKLLDIDKTTVSKLEAGKWNFGIDTLNAFAIALGFDVALLLKS